MTAAAPAPFAALVRKIVDEDDIGELHGYVITLVEKPLLKAILERARWNQSAAAQMLGINRNTLRKLIERHGIALQPAVRPKPVTRYGPLPPEWRLRP